MSLTHLWDKNRAHEEVRKELAYAWGNKIALGPKLKKERRGKISKVNIFTSP